MLFLFENRLCGLNGFHFRSGPWELKTQKTTASTALAVGDALSSASGAVALGATGTKTVGVMLGTKTAADTATTAKQYLKVFSGRTKFLAEAKDGTLAATDEETLNDLSGASGAMGFDSDTATNKDIFLERMIVSGANGDGIVVFADPAWEHAVN